MNNAPAETVNRIQLVVLRSGLRFEIACPKVKFMRGGILKQAKRFTGLKTNDKAKHLAYVEQMIEVLDNLEGTPEVDEA